MAKRFSFLVVVVVFILVAGNLVIFPGFSQVKAVGKQGGEAQDVRSRVLVLQREVQLLNLINALELDEKQTSFILEKAREAKKLRENMLNSSTENFEHTINILERLKSVLIAGGNIPPKLRKEWFLVHRSNDELRREYEERVTTIAKSVESILEEHQLYVLENYVPCVIPPRGELAGQAQNPTHEEKLLARVRSLPDKKFEALKDRIAERTIEHLEKHLPRDLTVSDVEKEKQRIISVFVEARNMSDVEFELGKDKLVEKLLPGDLSPYSVDITTKIERFLLDPHIIPLLEEKLQQPSEST